MMNIPSYQIIVLVLDGKMIKIHFYNLKVKVEELWSLIYYFFFG